MKPVFPPTDMTTWPLERMLGLGFVGAAAVLSVALILIPRFLYRETESDCHHSIITSSLYRRWGLWVSGRDTITSVDDKTVCLNQRRLAGYGSNPPATKRIIGSDVTALVEREQIGVVSLNREPIGFRGVAWAYLVSLVFGVWLHYIPCIWWTCDYGIYDGGVIRVCLLIIGCLGLGFLLVSRTQCVFLMVEARSDGVVPTRVFRMSISGGDNTGFNDEQLLAEFNEAKRRVLNKGLPTRLKYMK